MSRAGGSSRGKRSRDDSDDDDEAAYGTRTYGGDSDDDEEEPHYRKWEKMNAKTGKTGKAERQAGTAKDRKKAAAREGDEEDSRMAKLPGKVSLSSLCWEGGGC